MELKTPQVESRQKQTPKAPIILTSNFQQTTTVTAAQNQPMPIIQARQTEGCLSRQLRNLPQCYSAIAAGVLLLAGGLFFATIVYGAVDLRRAWYIGAIKGALFGALSCRRLKTKTLFFISALLALIAGILLAIFKGNILKQSTHIESPIAGSYLNGISAGLVLVPTLILIGEESVQSMRGLIAPLIEMNFFAFGNFLCLFISSKWTWTEYSATQFIGGLCIFFALLALIMANFLVIESPINLLLVHEEEKALETLRHLQWPSILTAETYEQLEAHKSYIAKNKALTLEAGLTAGLPALLKLSIHRGMCAIANSFILYAIFQISLKFAFPRKFESLKMLHILIRMSGIGIGAFMNDFVGRKKPMLYGALFCAVAAIFVGCNLNLEKLSVPDMKHLVYWLMAIQIFGGIFSAPSSAYLSEAFPLAVKPFYIAVTLIVELLVHIIITLSLPVNEKVYVFVAGGLFGGFFMIAIFFMPETKLKSLSEAQQKFLKF